jgi:hypothetical protein
MATMPRERMRSRMASSSASLPTASARCCMVPGAHALPGFPAWVTPMIGKMRSVSRVCTKAMEQWSPSLSSACQTPSAPCIQ